MVRQDHLTVGCEAFTRELPAVTTSRHCQLPRPDPTRRCDRRANRVQDRTPLPNPFGDWRRRAATSDERTGPEVPAIIRSVGIPSGLVTLLFTDIEGSTRLWEEHPSEMAEALARHDHVLRSAIEQRRGFVFKTVGDAFCAAFGDVDDALLAAAEAQRALDTEPWPEVAQIRVRIGLHTGRCYERNDDFFGPTVNRTARLQHVAHGGQIVCSEATAQLAERAGGEGLRFVYLGEHRLKDLGQPERVHQVGDGVLRTDFPPLRSLSNPELMNNLPAQVTNLIGRTEEVEQARELLRGCRLLSMTGAGGVGKTRLALQVAAEMLDGTGDGVWLVELAPVTDPDLVASAVAAAVHVPEEPGWPVLDTLAGRLRDKKLLIVLDNCEHVVDAAAKVVDVLLRRCPELSVLCTSREPLGIVGEKIYRVPSLPVPAEGSVSVDAIAGCDAVQLLVERAVAHRRGFALDAGNALPVASICRRLDGVPLAIELAGARLRTMSIDELERRLDDRFRLLTGGDRVAMPRHRTLRALIDWSYDLLSSYEQGALRRLSVFVGGWTIDAAEVVAGYPRDDPTSVLDCLLSLVDKSLVQMHEIDGQNRYYLLESVRQYGDERMRAIGEPEAGVIRDTHAGFYLNWAEDHRQQLIGPEQETWSKRFDVEYPNLAAAVSHFLGGGSNPEQALRLTTALSRYWTTRGQWNEGARTSTAAIERTAGHDLSPERVAALVSLSELKGRQGDYRTMLDLATESLDGARRLALPEMIVHSVSNISVAQRHLGDLEASLTVATEAVDAARRHGDLQLLAQALSNLGGSHDALGDLASARRADTEALALYTRHNDRRGVAVTHGNLAYYEQSEGNLGAAEEHLVSVLEEATALGETSLIANAKLNLGYLGLQADEPVNALQHFVEVLDEAQRTDARMDLAYAVLGLAICASASGNDEASARLHGAGEPAVRRSRSHPSPVRILTSRRRPVPPEGQPRPGCFRRRLFCRPRPQQSGDHRPRAPRDAVSTCLGSALAPSRGRGS